MICSLGTRGEQLDGYETPRVESTGSCPPRLICCVSGADAIRDVVRHAVSWKKGGASLWNTGGPL